MVIILQSIPLIQMQWCWHGTIITGTGDHRRQVHLLPIYNHLGKYKTPALPGLHTISSCDMTDRLKGKRKAAWWKVFIGAESEFNIITA